MRVIDCMLNKRTKDDIVLLFGDRSRLCRKVIGQTYEKLAASGAHRQTEIWIVYNTPTKKEDPRVPQRQTSFANNNREVVMSALPAGRCQTKVKPLSLTHS